MLSFAERKTPATEEPHGKAALMAEVEMKLRPVQALSSLVGVVSWLKAVRRPEARPESPKPRSGSFDDNLGS